MSDKPLFQNTDAQEAAYAPDTASGAEDIDTGSAGVLVPGSAASITGGTLGSTYGTSGGMGALPVIGPGITSASPDTEGANRAVGADDSTGQTPSG